MTTFRQCRFVQKHESENVSRGSINKEIVRRLDFLPENIVFWLQNIYLFLVFAGMTQPENEDELSEEQKKNASSIIVALVAVVIIGISFVWHLWSALFPTPSP